MGTSIALNLCQGAAGLSVPIIEVLEFPDKALERSLRVGGFRV